MYLSEEDLQDSPKEDGATESLIETGGTTPTKKRKNKSPKMYYI